MSEFASLNMDEMLQDFFGISEEYWLARRHGLNEGAKKHLHRGLLVRVNMLIESVTFLNEELQSADGPLSSYLATRLTLFLNVYYLNLAGSLDNLAWALIYHHTLQENINEDNQEQRQFAQLLNKNFLKAIQERGLDSLYKKIQMLRGWYWEIKKFRDPAAHRIPVLVPSSIYTEQDAINADYLDIEAAKFFREGNHSEGMKTFQQIGKLGRQMPVFISETTSIKVYDLAGRINLDHKNWYSIVNLVLSEGFS